MTNNGSSRQTNKEPTKMKVTLLSCLAGPDGVARPNTVLNVPEALAKEWIDKRSARKFDAKRDEKFPVGMTKPVERFEP